MSQLWHVSQDGRQQGPFTPEQLKSLAESGRLNPSDLVWKNGLSEWVTAASVKGLFTSPVPPPLPQLARPGNAEAINGDQYALDKQDFASGLSSAPMHK